MALFLLFDSSAETKPSFPGQEAVSFKEFARASVPFAVALISYFILRMPDLRTGDSAIGYVLGRVIQGSTYDLSDTLKIALKVFGFYAKKLVVPFPLNFAIVSIGSIYLWIGLLSVIADTAVEMGILSATDARLSEDMTKAAEMSAKDQKKALEMVMEAQGRYNSLIWQTYDALNSLPRDILIQIRTELSGIGLDEMRDIKGLPPARGGGGRKPKPTPSKTGRPSGRGATAQAGLDMIVPGGFPNDTFPINVSSGERVRVTPAADVRNDNRQSIIIQPGAVVINGATANPAAIAAMVSRELGRLAEQRQRVR